MDAVSLLIADHNRVKGMFARYQEAHEAEDQAAAEALVAQIFQELEVHTTIEEDVFYPAVKDLDPDISETVDEGVEEHHVVDVLMAEMKEVEAGSDEWAAKMMVLIENVEHHVEEEESELFPSVRSSCSADDLEALGVRLEQRKAEMGAPVLADKIDLTKETLSELASEQQIPGRSKMSQEELAATVAPT